MRFRGVCHRHYCNRFELPVKVDQKDVLTSIIYVVHIRFILYSHIYQYLSLVAKFFFFCCGLKVDKIFFLSLLRQL